LEQDVVDLLVTPATKSKPRGQEGTAKMSGCNKLWLVCAVDSTGEQSAGAAPRRRGALLPPRAGGKRERENGERSRKTPQIEREAK
jgi:hypothetical protein